MTSERREILYVVIATMVAFVLHSFSEYMPVVLILPAIIAYTVSTPVAYLGFFSVAAELYSLQPFGVLTAAIFAPWLLMRIFHRISSDFTFSFLGLVAITLLVQFFILFLPFLGSTWGADGWSLHSFVGGFAVVPWVVVPFLLLPVVFIFVVAALVHYNRRW